MTGAQKTDAYEMTSAQKSDAYEMMGAQKTDDVNELVDCSEEDK